MPKTAQAGVVPATVAQFLREALSAPWLRFAACKPERINPEAFFPLAAANANPVRLTVANVDALHVCWGCPVLAECDAFARADPGPHFGLRIMAGEVYADRSPIDPSRLVYVP